jgi:hypothetical protein
MTEEEMAMIEWLKSADPAQIAQEMDAVDRELFRDGFPEV